jgi:hypothetical protein
MPIFGFPDNFRMLGQGYIGKIPIPVIIIGDFDIPVDKRCIFSMT